jgi:hypothetical protein
MGIALDREDEGPSFKPNSGFFFFFFQITVPRAPLRLTAGAQLTSYAVFATAPVAEPT